mmetsp:Transcript_33086/g.92675  ORF Transcript_33086/g.92675 Transcript_33086/m.92675 type:complete len:202 (+) Transcript_33086:195-800(+)
MVLEEHVNVIQHPLRPDGVVPPIAQDQCLVLPSVLPEDFFRVLWLDKVVVPAVDEEDGNSTVLCRPRRLQIIELKVGPLLHLAVRLPHPVHHNALLEEGGKPEFLHHIVGQVVEGRESGISHDANDVGRDVDRGFRRLPGGLALRLSLRESRALPFQHFPNVHERCSGPHAPAPQCNFRRVPSPPQVLDHTLDVVLLVVPQ